MSASYCVAVAVTVENSFWDTDKLSLGIAFLIGFIVGALICIVCARICMKDIYKSTGIHYVDLEAQTIKDTKSAKKLERFEETKTEMQLNKGKKKKKKATKRNKKSKVSENEDVPVTIITLDKTSSTPGVGGGNYGGLADILMRKNKVGMMLELANQDLQAVDEMNTENSQERINTMIQMLQVMLRRQLMQGKVSDDEYRDLVKDMQDSVQSVVTSVQQDRQEEITELERRYHDDSERLDEEIEKLNPKYSYKMHVLVNEEKEKLRKNLMKNPQLNEADVDTMLAEYSENMAAMEKKMEDERNRQTKNLEERLARRRQLAELAALAGEETRQDTEDRLESYSDMMTNLVDNSEMLDRQKDDLLQDYAKNMELVNKKYEEDLQTQQLKLAEKLRGRREERLRQLEAKQEEERELTMANAASQTANVAEIYHRVMERQKAERQQLMETIDEDEAQEFNNLTKKLQNGRLEEIEILDENMADKLKRQTEMTDKQVAKIMRNHKQQVAQLNSQRDEERARAQQKLLEKLEKRRLKAAEAEVIRQEEKEALQHQQDNTVSKLLGYQVELTAQAKDRIMLEHQQQMAAVNNQLEMSKLRQKKKLDAKLAARKAKVADLKEQQAEALRSAEKDKQKLAEKLEKEIEAEERRIEEEHKSDIEKMRKRLAEETEMLLSAREKELAVLIGRLQVGSARRQAVMARQHNELQQLQEKMSDRAMENVGDMNHKNRQLDELIIQHQAEVEQLQSAAQLQRDKQSRLLQEKLEKKRLMKTREVEEQLETDAQVEWEEKQARGAGLATSLLSQMMLEQRHKMAMNQLERDMEVELQKQTNQMNQDMEEELLHELAEQKKYFLSALAAMSNMSKSDINEVVESTVSDEKQAKVLAKDLRIGMKKVGAQNDDDYGYSRPQSSMNRRKSAKPMRKMK